MSIFLFFFFVQVTGLKCEFSGFPEVHPLHLQLSVLVGVPFGLGVFGNEYKHQAGREALHVL